MTNYFRSATSASKLRGAFYTPDSLVRLVLERLDPGPDEQLLQVWARESVQGAPDVGDGDAVFLQLLHLDVEVPA